MPSWFGKVNFVPYSKVSDFAVHLKDGRLMGFGLLRVRSLSAFHPAPTAPSA